jgi:hypothetical protein
VQANEPLHSCPKTAERLVDTVVIRHLIRVDFTAFDFKLLIISLMPVTIIFILVCYHQRGSN